MSYQEEAAGVHHWGAELKRALREAASPEWGTTCTDAYAAAAETVGALARAHAFFFAESPRAEELPADPRRNEARAALEQFRAQCLIPKAEAAAVETSAPKPWYKRMFRGAPLDGLGLPSEEHHGHATTNFHAAERSAQFAVENCDIDELRSGLINAGAAAAHAYSEGNERTEARAMALADRMVSGFRQKCIIKRKG